MDSSESFVRFKRVGFSYPGNPDETLKEVNFSIARGSRTLILGSNGSGKSTLVRLITGLLTPRAGEVLTSGLNTAAEENRRTIRERAGLLFQNPSSQIVATVVREDAAFGPENLGLASQEIRERVRNALERTGLSPLSRRATHDLSAGQQQRLSLAGVLALGSGCLILDEAASMLNPSARRDMDLLLDDLYSRGYTIIQVSHFMEQILEADHILILNRGELVFDGNKEELLEQADHLAGWSLKLPEVVTLSRSLQLPLCLDEQTLSSRIKEKFPENPGSGNSPFSGYESSAPDHEAPLLVLNRVNFDYNSRRPNPVPAVRNLDFSFFRGETAVFMGTTGSGKSTILQILNSLLLPQEGRVSLLGENPLDRKCDLTGLRRRIGLVMQQPEKQLFAPLTGDDIAYGPKLQGLKGRELALRVKEAMELMELSYKTFRDKPVRALSGGQKRKVALAGILAMKPEILLLDEPTAGLDPLSRDHLERLMLSLREEGISLIFSTHDVEQAVRLGSRLIVMDQGEKAFDGNPLDFFLRHDPALYGLESPLAFRIWQNAGKGGRVPLLPEELVTRLQAEIPAGKGSGL